MTLSTDDLTRALENLCPARIDVDEERWIDLARPHSVTLVAERGLRVVFEARVRWKVIGIDVPITVNEAEVFLEPRIVERAESSVIAFEIRVGELDVKFLPAMIDDTIAARINAALEEARPKLVWDFQETLDFRFALPEKLSPADGLRFRAKWAEVKVGAEALSVAISFGLDVTRARAVG